MIGIEGGRINIVPVDFVADALDYLAHKKGLDGKCFHLTDPEPHRIGEVLNIFAKAGARAADDDARQRADVRLHPGADPLRPRLAGAGQARDPRGADRPRHSARRVPVRQLADALRQPRGGEGAQGLGHRGAAARDLRGEAVGLLGAQPRPGPLHRSHARRAASRTRSSSSPAARRASARRRRSSSPTAGAQGDPRRARRGEARSRPSRRSSAAGGKCWIYTRRPLRHRVVRRARRARAEGARRAATTSSTTPAARSAAASSTRSTASTTSSGRCSSTTSARCGSSWASCRR